jgi:hypothetical protein
MVALLEFLEENDCHPARLGRPNNFYLRGLTSVIPAFMHPTIAILVNIFLFIAFFHFLKYHSYKLLFGILLLIGVFVGMLL